MAASFDALGRLLVRGLCTRDLMHRALAMPSGDMIDYEVVQSNPCVTIFVSYDAQRSERDAS